MTDHIDQSQIILYNNEMIQRKNESYNANEIMLITVSVADCASCVAHVVALSQNCTPTIGSGC